MNKRKACCCSDVSGSKLKKWEGCEKVIIAQSPPSLKNITASRIAVSLWYHEKLNIERDYNNFPDYADDSNRDPDYSEVFDGEEESFIHRFKNIGLRRTFVGQDALRKRVENSVQQIPIPEQLRDLVKDYPSFIERQLMNWLCYHQERILFLLIDPNMINCIIDVIVWRPDATIDYVSTARNMLVSHYLKDIQKYRLACTYCFEDEIRNTSSAIIDKDSIGLTLKENPLEYYWSCYSKNELNKINIGDAPSIESYMLTRTRVNNWASIEYFFDRLDSEEQIVKAKYLIRKYGITFQTALLLKLNAIQQNRVFTECSTVIITNYAKLPWYNKCALIIWQRYKNLVTSSAFSKMIDSLLLFLHDSDTEVEETKMKNIESLLCNIWSFASDELRSHALNDEEYYILDHFLFNDFTHPNINRMKLISLMLSDADETSKSNFFDQTEFARFCKILVKSYDADFLDRFLKICSSNTDQVTRFKKKIMNTREIKLHCKELIKKSNLDSLNDILTSNLANAEDIVAYKKEILKFICISELRAGIYDNTHKMIDNCLSDVRKSAALKKEILLDGEIVNKFFQDINDGKFDLVKSILEQFFVYLVDLRELQMLLLLTFKSIITSGTFSELRMNRWNEFFTWCLANDVKMAKFKNALPIDNIFTDLLLKSVFVSSHRCIFRSECNFENLNILLDWHFETKAEIKQYKISQVLLSKKINVIDTIIENKKTEILKSFLEWCFENDQELINQFKMDYEQHAVIKFL